VLSTASGSARVEAVLEWVYLPWELSFAIRMVLFPGGGYHHNPIVHRNTHQDERLLNPPTPIQSRQPPFIYPRVIIRELKRTCHQKSGVPTLPNLTQLEENMLTEEQRAFWSKAAVHPHYYGEPADPSMGNFHPRIYADVPSFMETPVAWEAEDLQGTDAVFIGVPWEGGRQQSSTSWATTAPRQADPEAIIGRHGAFSAPEWLRKWSMVYSLQQAGGHYPEVSPEFRLADHLKLADYRNVDFKEWDPEDMASRSIERITDIVRAGAVPIVFGGDHSIPYPAVRAISDNTAGNIGIIQFDTHYDLEWGGRLNAGNQFARILDTCKANPENMVQIGIQGSAVIHSPLVHQVTEHLGITVFTSGDVERMGIIEVIKRSIEIVTQDTERVYVSLDVDVMDPATFPSQKYASAFGLSAGQVRQALSMISRGTNLAGFDMCCLGPAYDYKGLGLMTACRLTIEVLIGMALRKMGH
jgi:agmatinase